MEILENLLSVEKNNIIKVFLLNKPVNISDMRVWFKFCTSLPLISSGCSEYFLYVTFTDEYHKVQEQAAPCSALLTVFIPTLILV